MSIRNALALTLLAATAAEAEEQVPQLVLDWQSSGREETLATEIARLYVTLHNSGNLAVRQAPLTDGFVETLLREAGVFRGSYFPVELDALLCDLNSAVCSRDLRPAAATDLADLGAHVGGYTPTRGRWKVQADQVVTIPDYSFDSVTSLTRVPAPAGFTTASYQPPANADCTPWKMSCAEVVARFNPPQIRMTASPPSVTLPIVQWTTAIPLRPDEASKLSSRILQTGAPPPAPAPDGGVKAVNFAVPDTAYSSDWKTLSVKQSPTDVTVDALRRTLAPIGTINRFGVADEPLAGEQVPLFELINHPFAQLQDLPPELHSPVGIAVFESHLENGHCDLPTMERPDGTEIAPPGATDPDGCDQVDALSETDADHAAGVMGVIASQENGKGIVGINPEARLVLYDYDRDDPADRQLADLVRNMQIGFPEEVRVANLSLGVRPIVDTGVRNALDIQRARVLIVAAAGNEGLGLSPGCAILPACLNDLDNVITVIGLNTDSADPAPWRSQTQGSNTSPFFDIGAPAEAVLTTVTHNRFARKTGTSFAAPQVAAAASLVFSAGETVFGDNAEGAQLSPKAVKDRLIYTADFFPSLNGKVRSGRLNIGRAIAVADAQFTLFDGRSIVGQVIEAPAQFACRGPGPGHTFPIWWNVRRLVYNEVRRRHILYTHAATEQGSRDAELERDASCLVATLSAPVKVLTRDGSESRVEEFTFADIRDYTSPLFDE